MYVEWNEVEERDVLCRPHLVGPEQEDLADLYLLTVLLYLGNFSNFTNNYKEFKQ